VASIVVGQRRLDVAARGVGLVGRVDLVGLVELGVVGAQDDVVGLGVVVDAHPRRCLARGFEAVGDGDGDDLPAVADLTGLQHGQLGVVVRGQARGVLVPEHGERSRHRERVAGVDGAYAALGHRGRDEPGVGHAVEVMLDRVPGLPGDLLAPLHAGQRGPDGPRAQGAGHQPASSQSSVSVRTRTRCASATLKALSRSG
jgi:hypothetical protein